MAEKGTFPPWKLPTHFDSFPLVIPSCKGSLAMPSFFLGKHMPVKKLGILLRRKRLGINIGRQLGVCDEVRDESLVLGTGRQLARDLVSSPHSEPWSLI